MHIPSFTGRQLSQRIGQRVPRQMLLTADCILFP